MQGAAVAANSAGYTPLTGDDAVKVKTGTALGVAQGVFSSTQFEVSAQQESGPSVLEVVANGVASDPVFVLVL